MINYNNTLLYKIYNDNNDDIYYGISASKSPSILISHYKHYLKNNNSFKN